MNKIKKIKTGGLPYVLRGLRRLFCGKKEIIDIYVLDVENKASRLPGEVYREKIKSLGEGFEIKVLSPDDASYHYEFADFIKKKLISTDSDIEMVLKRSTRFVALSNKRIVAVTCLAPDEYPLDELEFDFMLGANKAYRFKSFVDEEYRRKGIMLLLWDREVAFAIDNGYKYLVAAIRQWNKASYIPTLKIGFEKYATAMLTEHFFIQQRKFIKVHNFDKNILSFRLFSGEIVKI